ncbi:MAG: hypothetical protein AAGI13_03070 [Pseudomonadota bacterium]
MADSKITAQLPSLDVEFTRQELPEQKAEVITMRLTATPSFDAFGSHLLGPGSAAMAPLMGPMSSMAHAANPMAAMEAFAPWMNPAANPMLAPMQASMQASMQFWGQMAAAAWAPWFGPFALAAPGKASGR